MAGPTIPSPAAPAAATDPLETARRELREKLKKTLALKDYALSKNLSVPDDILNSLSIANLADDTTILGYASAIDQAIMGLTAITFPATIDTVSNPLAAAAAKSFKRFLFWSAVLGILTAIGSSAALSFIGHLVKDPAVQNQQTNEMYASLYCQALAGSLGFLGSMTYIYFNFIGVLSEQAFNIEDTEVNKVRLLLGIMCGWLFYFFFSRPAYRELVLELGGTNPSNSSAPTQPNPLLLLLPFLVGFSTKLVVGVLSQAVRAVELTLGLDSKAAQLAQRKSKSGKQS